MKCRLIPYENAADLENTLNAVRQGLDAKLTIWNSQENRTPNLPHQAT